MKALPLIAIKTVLILGGAFLISFNAKAQSTNSTAASTNAAPPAPAADSTNTIDPAAPANDGVTSDAIIKKAKATYAALQSYSDTGTASTQMGTFATTTTFTTLLQRPGFYLVSWQSNGLSNKGMVWADGTGDFLQASGLGLKKESSREMALASATGISGGIAAGIPGTFFAEAWGNKLGGKYQRTADEKIDGVDCYVLASKINTSSRNLLTTLWIGRQDSLIHQIKTKMDNVPTIPPIDDATLTKTLAFQNKPATPETMDALRKQLTTVRDMASSMMKGGGIEFNELHTNIVTDKTFTPDDFMPWSP
jgi:hypothetical protein